MTRYFNLDNQTEQKIKEEAHKMHLNQTKFIQFLVWQHVNAKADHSVLIDK